MLVASSARPSTADAASSSLAAAAKGAAPIPSVRYAGYLESVEGPVTLDATVVVPTVKCTNPTTWNADARLVAVMDSQSGVTANAEHGGGVQVGCSQTGVPTYSAIVCDPLITGDASYSAGCAPLEASVLPGDQVQVQVVASGSCNPTCTSVVSTVSDLTHLSSTSATSSSATDFNAFVALVGTAPLVDFGKATMTGVALDDASFAGQRSNLYDFSNRLLVRSSALSKVKRSFTLKWVRAL